jgi:diguanylate cyclase (GGDEF)-like protein
MYNSSKPIHLILVQNLLARNLLVFFAYLLTAWLGLSVPFEGDKVTLFWLPSGIAVAALYRWGWSMLPAIFFAALIINLLTGAELLTNLIIACGNSMGPLATVILLKKTQCDLTQLNKYTAIKTIAITSIGMLIPATIGASALTLQHHFSLDKSLFVVLIWWMGDSLGVFLCAPLLINLSLSSLKEVLRSPHRVFIFLTTAIFTGLICFPLNQFNHGNALPIVFITFVCVAWAALSFGLIAGAFCSLCFSFIAIWSTANNLGPFVFSDIHMSYWVIWVYTIVMTLLCMMITAAHKEIIDTSQKLFAANEKQKLQLQEIQGLDAALAAAAADSANTEDFFATLLRSLSKNTGAAHVKISLVNYNLTQATTHTYLIDGRTQTNFTYMLKHTPCADVLEQDFCFISANAQTLYPKDDLIEEFKIQSYVGIAIKNIEGNPIGILSISSTQPIQPKPQINSLMRIFSERIAGEIRRAEDQEKIFNLAFFDPLTHLPNRRFLQERLNLIAAQSERNKHYCAILFIDLDNFKFLNDSRGHHVGDQLLALVGERIHTTIRNTDMAARLGGDEFVVVFDNLNTDMELAAVETKKRAEELHSLISLPYALSQTHYHCTISMGVNIFRGTQGSIDDLLRHADLAMYQAKDSGRNAIRFFDPQMQSQMERRASIEHDLRIAIEVNDQLIPYYQIQVNHTGAVIGAELLLRWIHPNKGMVSPGDFIPIAEQTGLIVPLGRKVLKMACVQLVKWKTQPEFTRLKLAVNVSPIQFNQSDFVHDINALILENDIDTQLLTLELTEGSLLQNVESSVEKMHAIRLQKIGFSMDDFGIGYSSLSYLKKLPLNQLKIDQSFVRDISTDPNDRVIVRTIIAMAQNLELEVLAEGVETLEQKNYLLENGCQKFQGYYFGRPVPIKEFEEQRLTFL